MFSFITLLSNFCTGGKNTGEGNATHHDHISKGNQSKLRSPCSLLQRVLSGERQACLVSGKETPMHKVLLSLWFVQDWKSQVSSGWVPELPTSFCLCVCTEGSYMVQCSSEVELLEVPVLPIWSWRKVVQNAKGKLKTKRTTWLQIQTLAAKRELKLSSCYILSTSARAVLRFHFKNITSYHEQVLTQARYLLILTRFLFLAGQTFPARSTCSALYLQWGPVVVCVRDLGRHNPKTALFFFLLGKCPMWSLLVENCRGVNNMECANRDVHSVC